MYLLLVHKNPPKYLEYVYISRYEGLHKEGLWCTCITHVTVVTGIIILINTHFGSKT